MTHRLPERDRPWMMRTYAGHSTAARSNELYRRNLAKGQTGLSVAFDLPTQTGYDADLADLAARELVVGVVAGLRRQVEGYGQPGLALGQVAPVQRVGPRRRGVPRVRAHHPRPIPFGQPVRHT